MFDDLRSAWDARRPTNKPTLVNPARRTEFMAHYDGGTALNLPTHADCLARVKADQAFHMDGRGWSDIGYNGLICQHGRAIEGRGIDYAGAHCPNHNATAYGFQFMVGGTQTPTPAAYARMARAQADCATRSGHALRKLGHRDGFATECPGDAIQAWVRAGMPGPAQEDEVTPDDIKAIADEVLRRPVKDLAGNDVTVGAAIGYTLRNSIAAAQDSRAARALAEAAALAGRPLTSEETAQAVRDALAATYNVTLTPKDT